MAPHWHAYTYTGHTRPPDREARDPLSATPPLVIAEWPAKPRSMLAGTFTDPGPAVAWLEQQLTATPPMATDLPAASTVAYARSRIAGRPADVVTRYYTAGGYVARDLVQCVGRCPSPPR